MIWHSESITVLNAPTTSSVRLIGIYNPVEDRGSHPAVELKVEIIADHESTALIITIYSHTPSGLGHQEEPSPEDVFNRYHTKVAKAKRRLEATDFSQLDKIKRLL